MDRIYQLFGVKNASHNSSKAEQDECAFLSSLPEVQALLLERMDTLTDECLIKILRQLKFWHAESSSTQVDMLALTKRLLQQTTSSETLKDFQCPKVRFGKTELQMPLITCGGMRIQYSWIPDTLPIAPSAVTVLQSESQPNLKAVVRKCLQHGLNHFETARMYGTSELQFATALGEMMRDGEIQRSDFLLQTKIVPTATKAEFAKLWNASWKHWESTIGYIDLFAFHVPSSQKTIQWLLKQKDSCMEFVQDLMKQGKIKHLGFSTHGTSRNVLQLVNTELFSYVNIHVHYFGDYHAVGTMNESSDDQHGNRAALDRAKELDMGIFQISPLDKGGKVYQPSSTLTRLLGPGLSPISFALLHGWETLGFQTTSVGISRPSDIDDALYGAYLYHTQPDSLNWLKTGLERLNQHREQKLGQEWNRKGLLNLPDCENPTTNGIAIGHALWCHDVIEAFGMYDFAKDRYKSLADAKWDHKKAFEENLHAYPDGNMGRNSRSHAEIEDLKTSGVLKDHYNPDLVVEKLQQVEEWLGKANKTLTEEERNARGWDAAYNLTVWVDFPGIPTMNGVLLQNLTLNYFGCGGGPSKVGFAEYAKAVRASMTANKAGRKDIEE